MSSNLYAEPAQRKKLSLSTELKFALRKRFGEPIKYNADRTDVPYFQGLFDAGIEDAKKLIDMIDKHSMIVLSEEW